MNKMPLWLFLITLFLLISILILSVFKFIKSNNRKKDLLKAVKDRKMNFFENYGNYLWAFSFAISLLGIPTIIAAFV